MKLESSRTIYKTQTNITSNTAPIVPTIGQQWIDTSNENPIYKEWDGENWGEVNFNIEKIDPITIGDIKNSIDNAVGDINNNKEQIQGAIDKSQEAIDKAGLNEEQVASMKEQVDQASINASNAINKAEKASTEATNAMDSLLTFKGETNQQFTEIKGDVNGLQTTVSNIQVGGVNLFKNSDTMSDDSYWENKGVVNLNDGEYTVSNAWAARGYKLNKLYEEISDIQYIGKPFMFSVDIKIDNNSVIPDKTSLVFYSNSLFRDGITVVRLNDLEKGKWVRVKVKTLGIEGEIKGVVRVEMNKTITNGLLHVRHLKLEQGNIATNWEEETNVDLSGIENSISQLTQTSEQIQSQVDNKADHSEVVQLASSITEQIENIDGKVATVSKTANGILTTINDPTTGLDATYNKAQSAQGELTQIKNLEGSSTIVNTVKGVQTTVESKADKSQVTQLAGQINSVVESQDSINQQIQTATGNITQIKSDLGKTNSRLETAEGTIEIIEKTSSDNTTLINQVKKTADSNKTIITDTTNKLTTIESNLNGIETSVSDLNNNLTTKIQQNANNINLIASGESTSYFQVSGDYIYAKSKKLMLDGNVTVGSGFTLSADKIRSKTLTGKNMSLNLDTGVYKTSGGSTKGETIIANGGIQSKKGTDEVNIGFGNDSYSTGFGIQLKRSGIENGVLAFDNDSFSVSTGVDSTSQSTIGVGTDKFEVTIGKNLGNRSMLRMVKSGSNADIGNISEGCATSVIWQDGKGGKLVIENNRPKLYANSSNYMALGPGYQDVYVNGNKSISVHETYIDINLNGVTRRIGYSTLPDGTPTFFFGTTDKKGGFHFTGGRPYVQIAGETYAFNTKYLNKL